MDEETPRLGAALDNNNDNEKTDSIDVSPDLNGI